MLGLTSLFNDQKLSFLGFYVFYQVIFIVRFAFGSNVVRDSPRSSLWHGYRSWRCSNRR